MFSHAQRFNVNGGRFVNVKGDQINNIYYDRPLQALYMAIKDVGATHDSEVRHPPPQCHPETRRDVLKLLLDWTHGTSSSDRMLWLYGPAGAGKSAIAQTVAEAARKKGMLAASFFFSRADQNRNNPKYLFLSLVFELAYSIPDLVEPIESAIKRNPGILQASLEHQFQKLIIEPCGMLSRFRRHARVIIIDGLDECNGSPTQQRILAILENAMNMGFPFRILLCSRPEPPIRESFDGGVVFRSALRRVTLDNTFNPGRDIKTFLTLAFEGIRNSLRNRHVAFPPTWPEPGVIDLLVQKASGQFIFASTVVKFVDDEYSNPCKQLEVILQLPILHVDPEIGAPFHDLDVLYHHILSTNPQRSKLRDVIWAILLILEGRLPAPSNGGASWEVTPRHIEALLDFSEGDALSTLRGMHSLFRIGGPSDVIHLFHASFGDFLRDATRSGYFFVGDERDQYDFLVSCCLRIIDRYSQVGPEPKNKLTPLQ